MGMDNKERLGKNKTAGILNSDTVGFCSVEYAHYQRFL